MATEPPFGRSARSGTEVAAGACDLVLAHGYFLEEDERERGIMKPYPPLGLLYLSAYLKRAGFGVHVLDATFRSRQRILRRLEAREAPVLGLYANLTTRSSVLSIARRARELGWLVVVGGPEPANYPAGYLDHGADVVVFGEGEATMAELLPAMAGRGAHRLQDIAGIAFRDETGVVIRTRPRPRIGDLDGLPLPDRGAIDLGPYLNCWRLHHGASSLNLITARGCPYGCRWCSHAVFGHRHSRRSPEAVVEEIAHLRAHYAPDQLWIADDVFTIDHRWLEVFGRLMGGRGLAMPFECITRADRVDESVAMELARLGCHRVWLGSESGSQAVLDAMGRGVTTEQVRAATRALQSAGIQVGLFVMWGYPGEGRSDVEATIDHVRKTVPDVCLSTVAYPIAGTPYFEQVRGSVRSGRPWPEASDREHDVVGRPTRTYYRFAARRLQHELTLARAVRERPARLAPIARAFAGSLRARAGMALSASRRTR